MFGFDVLQSRWLWAALLGGTALVLGFVLSYFAFWRQREAAAIDESGGSTDKQPGVWAWVGSFVPWILVVVYVGFVIYAIAYTLAAAANPPNW
jgi:uncharacterized membrane protein